MKKSELFIPWWLENKVYGSDYSTDPSMNSLSVGNSSLDKLPGLGFPYLGLCHYMRFLAIRSCMIYLWVGPASSASYQIFDDFWSMLLDLRVLEAPI